VIDFHKCHQTMAFLANKTAAVASTIWSDLLNNVSTAAAAAAPTDVVSDDVADGGGSRERHVVIVGPAGAGKTALVQMLKNHTALGGPAGNKAVTKSGYALDYYYIDIKDDESLDIDEKRTCSVWVVRGSAGSEALLQSEYNAEMLPDTLFVIALDFSKPWNIMPDFHQAIQNIQSLVSSLQVPSESVESLIKKQERKIQIFSLHSQSDKPAGNISPDDLLPLGQGVLTTNLGVPIMVACSKIDATSDLEKNYNYTEEHFDYIQQYLRTECLKLGASLVYMSSKDAPRYSSVLYKFILHSLYNLGHQTAPLASVVEKESIFVPAGWDSLLKIKTVQDNLIGDITIESIFCDVIKPQIVPKRSATEGQPFTAEDEQTFVSRAQSVLSKPTTGAPSSVLSPNPNMVNSPIRPRASPAKPMPGVGGTPGGGSASTPSEANLQHFFNSLLNTKSSPRAAGSAAGAATATTAAPSLNMAALQNATIARKSQNPSTNHVPALQTGGPTPTPPAPTATS
jgi:dynein light intermediate chain 1